MAGSEAIDLEALDALRYENVYDANQRAAEALAAAPLEQLPRLLGIYASTERQLDDPREAKRAIALGLRIARSLRDRSSEADLYQRLAYVFGGQGQFPRAVDLSKRAAGVYLDLLDFDSVGRCLVDQGQWLYYTADFKEARKANRVAVLLLPETLRRSRFSALLNLAYCERKLRRPRAALTAAAAAEEYRGAVGPALLGKLTWFQASTRRDRGDHVEAARLFELLVSGETTTVLPIERAIAAVDLVYCLFQTGELDRAYSTCRSYVELLTPLRHEPRAQAAITELINCGHEARGLTVRFLAGLRKRLKARSASSRAASGTLKTVGIR